MGPAPVVLGCCICGLGGVGWLIVRLGNSWRPWAVPALGLVLVGDLLWFAQGRSAQCDPALYFPRIPALEQIAKAPPGTIEPHEYVIKSLNQTEDWQTLYALWLINGLRSIAEAIVPT